MNKRLLTGLIAAPFTPMHEDGSLNLQVIGPYAEFLMQKKCVTYGAYNEAVFSMVGENGRKALRTKWFRHVRENGLNISKRFFSLHGLTSALRLRGFSADLRAIALHRACRWG